jgi:anti-anti-sigma factor
MLKIYTTKSGNVLVVCLQGRIVRGETDVLRNAVLSEPDASAVWLDLGRVTTIDAAGLGVMLDLREHIQSRGIEFRLRNVTRLVRQVLEITRLDSVFKISAETTVAANSFRLPPTLQAAASAYDQTQCSVMTIREYDQRLRGYEWKQISQISTACIRPIVTS